MKEVGSEGSMELEIQIPTSRSKRRFRWCRIIISTSTRKGSVKAAWNGSVAIRTYAGTRELTMKSGVEQIARYFN